MGLLETDGAVEAVGLGGGEGGTEGGQGRRSVDGACRLEGVKESGWVATDKNRESTERERVVPNRLRGWRKRGRKIGIQQRERYLKHRVATRVGYAFARRIHSHPRALHFQAIQSADII